LENHTAVPYTSASRQGRPFHKGVDAARVPYIKKKQGNENHSYFHEERGREKFYENIDPSFPYIVTAGKSRDLIMHVDGFHCTVFLSQMPHNFFNIL
jgi:hypothetical protein